MSLSTNTKRFSFENHFFISCLCYLLLNRNIHYLLTKRQVTKFFVKAAFKKDKLELKIFYLQSSRLQWIQTKITKIIAIRFIDIKQKTIKASGFR